jgi:hypothetical protein
MTIHITRTEFSSADFAAQGLPGVRCRPARRLLAIASIPFRRQFKKRFSVEIPSVPLGAS